MAEDDKLFDIIDVLVEVAEEREVSPARVALAWLLHQPAVTSVIIGGRTKEQFADNLAAAELKLRAVGADPQPDLESERRREPCHGGWNVRIVEDGHDRRRRHGKVRPHPDHIQFCGFEGVRPRPIWFVLEGPPLGP